MRIEAHKETYEEDHKEQLDNCIIPLNQMYTLHIFWWRMQASNSDLKLQ